MIRDTRPQDETGMSIVNKLVGKSGHGWQPYLQNNDVGIDGLVILRKLKKNAKNEQYYKDTGEVFYVQVKCGTGNGYSKQTKKRPLHFGINVGEEYIISHRPYWESIKGAVIMIFVDFNTEKAWWCDLKDNNSFTTKNKSIILVPKQQRFGIQSFGVIRKLPSFLHTNKYIKTIELERKDVAIFGYTLPLKEQAKKYFKSIASASDNQNPKLGEIIFSREGWRHITRRGRKPENIINSWKLLGVGKKIIKEIDTAFQIKVEKPIIDSYGNEIVTDFITLRANVIFPERQNSIVQVILKRQRKTNASKNLMKSKVWFYSIYEPMRNKNLQ